MRNILRRGKAFKRARHEILKSTIDTVLDLIRTQMEVYRMLTANFSHTDEGT